MSEKCIIFVEDKTKLYYDLVETANRWIRFNQKKSSNFKHLRTVFGVQQHIEDDGKVVKPEQYDRIIKVYYEGDDSVINPSECDHSSTKDKILIQPTCHSLGKKNVVCTKCGSVVKVVSIPKTSPYIW